MSAGAGNEPSRMVKFFDDLVRTVGSIESGHDIVGLSEEEIESVRFAQGVASFPAYYDEFLRRMGKDAGVLLVGTYAFYPRLLEIKSWVADLLAENNVLHLMSTDAVAIALHQGYEAYWLETQEGLDPPVVKYVEGGSGLRTRWASFSEFLNVQAVEAITYWRPV
jgi:hypothetical protein